MPMLEDFESDYESDIEMTDVRQTIEHATPPPAPQHTFASKADLASGILDDEIPDYDYMDDSEDSDLEIYVKGSKPHPEVYSIADSEEEAEVERGAPRVERDAKENESLVAEEVETVDDAQAD